MSARLPPTQHASTWGPAWLAFRIWLLLLATTLCPVARAEPASLEPLQLCIGEEVPAPVAERLTSAILAELVDLGRLTQRREEESPAARCSVWLRGTSFGMELTFVDAQGVLLASPRTFAQQSPELLASEVASVVRAFALALRDERSAALAEQVPAQPAARADAARATESASPSAPAPNAPAARTALVAAPTPASEPEVAPRQDALSQPRSASTPWHVRLAMFYAGHSFARQLGWWSGLRAELDAHLKGPFYAGASYSYFAPVELPGEAFTVRLVGHDSHLFAGLARAFARFELAMDVGLMFSLTARETTQVSPMLAATPASAGRGLGGALRLHGRVRIPALPRLALDLSPSLEVSTGSGALLAELRTETAVLSPHKLRGRLDVGASFDLF